MIPMVRISYILNVMFYPQLLSSIGVEHEKLTNITYYDIVYISHSVFGKENPVEILVNSREWLWNYHVFTLNMYTGKKKQNSETI